MGDTVILDQADRPTLQAPTPRVATESRLTPDGRGRVQGVRAWVAAAVCARLEAALLSGIVLVLIAVGWLLRLVPALDVELADMEEHERPSTATPPDRAG